MRVRVITATSATVVGIRPHQLVGLLLGVLDGLVVAFFLPFIRAWISSSSALRTATVW